MAIPLRTLLAALLVPMASLAAPLAATAPADAAMATSGTLALSASSVTTGDAVTATGSFRKPYAGRKVSLQVADGSKWTTLTTRTTTAKGGYSLSFKPSDEGTMRLRALVAGGTYKGKHRAKSITPIKALKVVAPTLPGSEDKPFSAGQIFKNGSWSFTFGATDLDAWPELQAADEDNVAPAAGWSYVMVPVTFRNDSKSADDPYTPNDIKLQGGDAEMYTDTTEDQECGTVPNDWTDAGSLAPGASVTLNVCAVVPTSALKGGLWDVYNDDADDDSYVYLS